MGSCFVWCVNSNSKEIVAKRANSPHEDDARNPHWIKIKNPTNRPQGMAKETCSSEEGKRAFRLID